MRSFDAFSIYALTLLMLSTTQAYNYLMVLNTPARSHYNVGSALAKGLAAAGHQVTVVSTIPLKKPVPNYHDVLVPNVIKSMSADIAGLFNKIDRTAVNNHLDVYDMGFRITLALFDDKNFQALLQSNQSFDAVICETFFNEAHYGLAEHFNAPLIGLSTFGAMTLNTDLVGTPSPPSYVPHMSLPFNDHMTLWQRIENLAFLTFERLVMTFYYLPRQAAIYKEYFPHNKLSMYEARKNFALVLLNQHVSLSFPRPYSPNMIEVGGMHINRQNKPLPADMEKFINESENGVIYFSMGSNLKSKDIPLAKRQELLKAFRGIKQRVLWKFEETNLPDKPANVFISDWFPQDDILAHKNVLAFITHGGQLSTTESIYHGKPFIGLPIFSDQFFNMARAEQSGYGIMLDYRKLSAAQLKAALVRITSEPSYTKIVREMSANYRDQFGTPLERAVYWVEHVTRTNGAKYLRSAGQDLNFIQYHNLDAILILYGGILLGFLMLISLMRRIFMLIFKKQTQKLKVN